MTAMTNCEFCGVRLKSFGASVGWCKNCGAIHQREEPNKVSAEFPDVAPSKKAANTLIVRDDLGVLAGLTDAIDRLANLAGPMETLAVCIDGITPDQKGGDFS